MLDDKRRAELDQAKAESSEILPAIWSSIYRGLKEEFSEQQAWELLKIIVFAQSGGKGFSG